MSARGAAARAAAAGGLIGGGAAAWAWFESTWVERTHRVVRVRGLPAALDGLRILHVSDTHFPADGASTGRFRRAVEELSRKPGFELVLATGDYVETAAGWDAAARAMAELPGRAETYAVLGAHDYLAPVRSAGEWMRAARERLGGRRRMVDASGFVGRLEESGIAVLRNERLWAEVRGREIVVAGAGDASAGMCRLDDALPAAGEREGEFTILLTHAPDAVLGLDAARMPAAAFCGHTHGGQIRVPGWGAPVRHSRLAERRRAAGEFEVNGGKVVVSRGFGTAIVPLRFACRPELCVVELRGG